MDTGLKSIALWKPLLAFLAICAVTLACGGKTNTQPQGNNPASSGQAQSGTLLFQDDFQDGQAQEWGISSAWNVEQDNDVYVFGASGKGGAWVTSGGGWTDYTFQTSANVTSGNLLLSIALTKQGRYGVRLGGDGVYLLKEQPSGTYNVIGQAGPITTGTWHTIALANQAGHIQVTIDQVLWFDYVDTTAPITQGTISVGALDGSRVTVDNVLVTKNQGTLPPGSVQAPPALANAPDASQVVEDLSSALPAGDVETIEQDVPAPPAPEGDQPDLVVSEVTFTPNPVIQGQPFTMNYLVENRGGGNAGAFTFSLHFHEAAGLADCNMDSIGLAPGQVAWGGCTRQVNGNTGNYPVEAIVDVENEIAESDEGNNQSNITLQVAGSGGGGGSGNNDGGQPDLVITNVSFDPNTPIQAQPFTVNYGIKNQGSSASGPFTFRLKFHAAANAADCNWDVDQLGPGEIAWGGCVRQINGDPGNYPVKATIDVESEIAESNENNNILETTLTLAGPIAGGGGGGMADLIVEDIVKASDTHISCNLRNVGNADAPGGFQVALFLNSNLKGRIGYTDTIPAGNAGSMWFTITDPVPYSAKCEVDYSNTLMESNEDNNSLEVTIQ